MATRSQAEAHRRDLDELVRLARNDLRIVLSRHEDAERVRDALLAALPALVTVYGAAAATLAADWYDDLRDASVPVGGFSALAAVLPDESRTDALARWAVGPLFSAEPDKTLATSRVSGGLQRIIADAGRQTITVSAIEDPKAKGWRRVTRGGCEFCRMLADRIYDGTPDFKSHDDCGCIAAPVFG